MALPTNKKHKVFEANRTRKFTRKFGKIFVTQVLWGTFLSLTQNWNETEPIFIRKRKEAVNINIISKEFAKIDPPSFGPPSDPACFFSC